MRVETIGDATLYLGDCLEILPTLGKVDAVVSDPPYGLDVAEWDKAIPPQMCLDLLLDKAKTVLWFGGARPDVVSEVLKLRPMPTRIGIWHSPFALTNSGGAFWSWQPFYIWGEMIKIGFDVIIQSAFADKVGDNIRYHPTQKGIYLMQKLLEGTSHQALILDPFMGSGTTGVACMNLGREFIGIEIEPKYFDIACRRIADAWANRPRLFAEDKPEPKQVELELN